MIGRDDDPELLAALLDHSPYVVMRVDGEGTIGWVNASIERLFGLPVASVIGTNILTYLDLTWDPEALASIGDALGAEGMRLPTLFRSNLPDGTSPIFEVWANAQLLHQFRERKGHVTGNCGDCEHIATCGGCRAVAYAYSGGDPLAGDPHCWVRHHTPDISALFASGEGLPI